MILPSVQEVDAAIAPTWPANRTRQLGNITLRFGGGGQRATAATVDGTPNMLHIDKAEAAMFENGEALFRVRSGESDLDQLLAKRGYAHRDETNILVMDVGRLADRPLKPVSAFRIWPPLAIMTEIWAESGTGADRIGNMARVEGPKTGLFGRTSGHPAGVGFAAIAGDVAMVHGVAVRDRFRRQKTAENMMIAAAQWAQDMGARWFAALCTRHNMAANALYESLGMSVVGHYHYRAKRPD